MNDAVLQFMGPGKLGYAWQFITLAGFHSNGLVVTKLSRSYANEGMLAYVRDIQRQEKVEEVELLKGQCCYRAPFIYIHTVSNPLS